MADVQRALREVDATVAVENVKTLDQIRGDSLASRSFAMQLLAGATQRWGGTAAFRRSPLATCRTHSISKGAPHENRP